MFLLALGFQYLALEHLHPLVQLVDRFGLAVDLLLGRLAGIDLLLPAGQGLAGELLVASLEGQLGPVVPILGEGIGLFLLLQEAALGGRNLGIRLANLDQILLHVLHGLRHDLFGILEGLQDVVEVGLGHSGEAIEQVHREGCFRRCCPSCSCSCWSADGNLTADECRRWGEAIGVVGDESGGDGGR